MLSYAILLDAGFVKRKLKLLESPVTADSFERLVDAIRAHKSLENYRLHRVYFYDAAPLARAVEHPVSGQVIEYGATQVFHENIALLKEVAKLPHVALRQGELTHDGWMAKWRSLRNSNKFDATSGALTLTCDDLKPVIRQKGVDMRIGMDIAALTLKKHVQIIVLVTADSDFVPAMKFARREGAQLYLFTLGHGTKDEMVYNSDLVIEAQARSLLETSRQRD